MRFRLTWEGLKEGWGCRDAGCAQCQNAESCICYALELSPAHCGQVAIE